MTKVISFEEKRQDSIEKRKRAFERVLFSEFLVSFAEIDENGTKFGVQLIDISREGCQFQIPFSNNNGVYFEPNKELTIRVYFTTDDFIPVLLKLKHGSEYIDKHGDAYMRYGGEFDKSLPSFEAFSKFIEFIYKFAEFSCIDKGESKVYFL